MKYICKFRIAQNTRARRRGQVTMMFSGILLFVLFCAAIVVDQGLWFQRQAHLQRAADNAALAGASYLAKAPTNVEGNMGAATDYAHAYAEYNGYKHGVKGAVVNIQIDQQNNYFIVRLTQPEKSIFGGVFGINSVNLSATAVAQYVFPSNVGLDITGGKYGLNDGPINLGLYGPDQIAERGDVYSAKYKKVKGALVDNPEYRPGGYNFFVNVPETFGATAKIQLYDPDSFDSGTDSSADGKRWDEAGKDVYKKLNSTVKKDGNNGKVVTKFTLWNDMGTPADLTDDVQIDSKTFDDSATVSGEQVDKAWFDSFDINLTTERDRPSWNSPGRGKVQFRLQTQTISGSNENGFNIRVARPSDTNDTFQNGGNGSSVLGDGTLPVNFGKGGQGQVKLGNVPRGATEITVRRFDSDTGVQAGSWVDYSNDGEASHVYRGQKPLLGGNANNEWESDVFAPRSSYNGGNWMAKYSAGASDNTTWDMRYEGPPSSVEGEVRLIK